MDILKSKNIPREILKLFWQWREIGTVVFFLSFIQLFRFDVIDTIGHSYWTGIKLFIDYEVFLLALVAVPIAALPLRASQLFIAIFVPFLAIGDFIEAFFRIKYRIYWGSDIWAILLNTNWEETTGFLDLFLSWTNILLIVAFLIVTCIIVVVCLILRKESSKGVRRMSFLAHQVF